MKATEANVVRLLARMLKQSFGAPCETKKAFDWTDSAPALSRIRHELKIAARDKHWTADAFFGAPLNLIFEFDEEAHFTPWRARTIELYPPDAAVNFDVRFYLEHCQRNGGLKPPVLEQKRLAFADAALDLLPPLHGLNPTLRIAQAELVDSPRQELRERELEKRLAKILDERVAVHAGTTFLQMLEHPSGKPWVPKLFGA